MIIHLLWVINQSGQLISKTSFTDPTNIGEMGAKPDLQLTMSSVLFSTYGMSQELTPNGSPLDSAGMRLIECAEHNIHIHETQTMVKFVLVTDTKTLDCTDVFRALHRAYVDHAIKNPFHVVDESGIGQPIRISSFHESVRAVVQNFQTS